MEFEELGRVQALNALFFAITIASFVLLINSVPQAPSGSAQDKQWSLCVFDDVIEHTGSVSNKLKPSAIPVNISLTLIQEILIFFCSIVGFV